MSAVDKLLALVAEQKQVAQEAKGGITPDVESKLSLMQEAITEQQAVIAALESEKSERKAEFEVASDARSGEIKRLFTDRSAKSPTLDAEHVRRLGSALWLYKEAARVRPTMLPIEQTNLYKEWKAMTSQGSAGYGTEWVPEGMSSALFDVFNLPIPEVQVFGKVQMPTEPFLLPTKTARTTAYVIGENTSITASDVTTAQVSMSSVKLAGRTTFSYELDEDGIFDMVPLLVDDISHQIADGLADGIQNGDADGTHMDYDTKNGAATLPAKHMYGLRYWAINKNSAAGKVDVSSAKTLAGFRSVRATMGKYGVNPNDLALFVNPTVYYAMLSLDEVETVEKFGPSATVRTGALAVMDGTPIYVSENVRHETYSTNGYNTNGQTNDESVYIYAWVPAWIIGYRRNLMFETDRVITTQSIEVVGSQRCIFKDRSASTDQTVAMGCNWS